MCAKPTKQKPGQVETTGHSWDGIEEYNNPMPRWWLYTFYVCIVVALLYSVAYPAWPMLTRATPGLLGFSQRNEVAQDIAKFNEMNAPMRERLVSAELTEISTDPELLNYANNAGAAVFRTWCAQCHGAGAAGVKASGYPNLLDDDWLWGGAIEDIHYTVSHGIRYAAHDETRDSQMPAFGELLEQEEIAQLVQFVRQISGQEHDAALATPGSALFEENCAGCHGEQAEGNRDLGAPMLSDAIWLYGGSVADITYTITNARAGVMPNWNARLSEAEIRSVALYVHGLGGGE